jgi:hypothetical protein
MRTFCLILCASAGCTFASPAGGGGGGDLQPGDDQPDAATQPAPRAICDRSDPSLRLCVDFEGAIADRSANGAAIAASGVSPMERDGEPAAALTTSSSMHLREAATLDIQGGLALDMWIRPTGKPSSGNTFWMLDNNTQYGASFTSTGAIRCVISGLSSDSSGLVPSDDQFHHVACTYDGSMLKIYIDGDLQRCAGLGGAAIVTTGIDGLAIGANLSGSDTDPDYDDRFVGGLDNVRVWARSDLDVCAAAKQTGCRTSCAGL